MDRLRRLIQEIHRRSLWQALGVYAVASWAVLQVVDTLGGAWNLPDWFPSLAFALLLVGLPVVLATAFVQEGGPGRAAATEVAAAGASAPATRLLTWRNALGGGVVAFALWGVVAAGWVLVGGGTSGRPEGQESATTERSVAVIPFVNMSGDPDNEYFSDGVTEELLNSLAQLPELRVPASTTSFAFKGRGMPVSQIADSLGVSYVLEGSVRKAESRVVITAQLIDARADRHLWSQTYERDLHDIFALQREIARAITDALQVKLGDESPLLAAEAPTTSQDAYDLYLRGRYELSQRGEHVAEAIRYFEEAVEVDSSYATAYGGLALARVLGRAYGADNSSALREGALEAADHALALDSTLSEPHTARGFLPRLIGLPTAERELRLAIRLDPNDANARHFLGWALMAEGSWDEAEESITRAILLDPSNPAHRWRRANLYLFVGRWAEAESDAREALSLSPNDFYARAMLQLALVMSGQVDSLRTMVPPDSPVIDLAERANMDDALRAMEGSQGPIWLTAWGAAWLDRPEIALEAVERDFGGATSADLGFGQSALASMALTPLGRDPRFQAILERFGMEAG